MSTLWLSLQSPRFYSVCLCRARWRAKFTTASTSRTSYMRRAVSRMTLRSTAAATTPASTSRHTRHAPRSTLVHLCVYQEGPLQRTEGLKGLSLCLPMPSVLLAQIVALSLAILQIWPLAVGGSTVRMLSPSLTRLWHAQVYRHHCIGQLSAERRRLREAALYIERKADAVQWALELYGFRDVRLAFHARQPELCDAPDSPPGSPTGRSLEVFQQHAHSPVLCNVRFDVSLSL